MSAVAVSTSPRRGFDSLEEEVHLDRLPVQGALPAWLTGSLIRTGPALWDLPGQTMNHWFDGLAMLHRFSFADQTVSYANRFLETPAYRAARSAGFTRVKVLSLANSLQKDWIDKGLPVTQPE